MIRRIIINEETETIITRERESNNYYDADSTDTKHHIKSFSVVGEEEYHHITTNICIAPKRSYTLLYALYRTGDSFSSHEGKIYFIDLFDTEDDADIIRQNVGRLKNAIKETVTLLTEDEQPYKIHVPWFNYFEKLESIETIELYEEDHGR